VQHLTATQRIYQYRRQFHMYVVYKPDVMYVVKTNENNSVFIPISKT